MYYERVGPSWSLQSRCVNQKYIYRNKEITYMAKSKKFGMACWEVLSIQRTTMNLKEEISFKKLSIDNF